MKVKLNEWAWRDEMSAVRLSDVENVQDHASEMQGYLDNFNLGANSDSLTGGGGTMVKREHTNYLMKGIRKDDDWRFFNQMMYNMINSLTNNHQEVNKQIDTHKAWQQLKIDLAGIALLAPAKT